LVHMRNNDNKITNLGAPMKRVFVTIIIILMSANLIAAAAPSNSGRVFYVDNVTGNDDNAGTSRSNAWASLDKVNSVTFKPGDRIFFKAGTVYTGQLKPKGSGKKGKPIIIDMYGVCLLYTSPSPRDATLSRMPSSA